MLTRNQIMRTIKALIILITLIGLVASASARAPHETTLADDVFQINQNGKINAYYLNTLDMEIDSTQEMFNQELQKMPEPFSFTEGKIQASMITFIENELLKVQEQRSILDDQSQIIDNDVEPIKANLLKLQDIIRELNP